MLLASLSPSGTEVHLRSASVPASLWNSLGRNIAPGQARNDIGGIVAVPLGRFLASRYWLGQALTTYACAIDIAPPLAALLDRELAERSEIDALMVTLPTVATRAKLVNDLVTVGFKRHLKPFQLRDLGHLLALSNGANFSVPGAGKTTVAYAVHALERALGRVNRLLVLAPLSAFAAWSDEVQECFVEPLRVARLTERSALSADVVLVNYQRLAASYDQITRWVLDTPTHVILDEAHRMKRGKAGEWGRACLDLAYLASRRDILTGTPAPQHPNDFVALIDFIWPHQSVRILPEAARRSDPPSTAMRDVSARLAPLFTRTTKAELGLEAPDRRVELVTMKPLQAEIYQALRTKMRHATNVRPRERAQWSQMGEVVMYLLEAASNPALLARAVTGVDGVSLQWPSLAIRPNSDLGEKVLHYGQHEVAAKFEKLVTMVAANASAGRKTLVWSNFVGTITTLADELLVPYRPAVVHGAVPSVAEEVDYATRESEIRRFREDPDCYVLLANPAAMSEGVSLHHQCHDAIYVDRTFNAGQYLQSVDRIHRLGLAPGTETRVRFLVCRDTVDETVDERVRTKAERLALMLSDASLVTMALPDEEAYGESVEPEDLDLLLEHLRHG
jgi:SNF2 family DNA or RNA helicase